MSEIKGTRKHISMSKTLGPVVPTKLIVVVDPIPSLCWLFGTTDQFNQCFVLCGQQC